MKSSRLLHQHLIYDRISFTLPNWVILSDSNSHHGLIGSSNQSSAEHAKSWELMPTLILIKKSLDKRKGEKIHIWCDDVPAISEPSSIFFTSFFLFFAIENSSI